MHKVRTSIRSIVENAIWKVEAMELIPKCIYLSRSAHDSFLAEINKERDMKDQRRKFQSILEIGNVPILIDLDCPLGGAYILGEAKENGKKFQDEKTPKINQAGGKEHG